jgi:anti-sigma B factor antagonist
LTGRRDTGVIVARVSPVVPHFELGEESSGDGAHIIRVRGEIHVSTAAQFAQHLSDVVESGKTAIVLDMTGVEFIDSTGLSVLLNALRRVTRQQGTLALAVSNPTVLRLFEITRLDSTFDLYPDRESAISRVRPAQDGRNSAGAP